MVLAVDENNNILSKPNTVPEGKLDINITATCDAKHTSSQPPEDIDNTINNEYGVPIDPWYPAVPGVDGGENEDEIPEGVIPDDTEGFAW